MKAKETQMMEVKPSCADEKCPFHGNLKTHGRSFEGTVIKKFPKRIVIEFFRTVYIPKFERYIKSRTRLHARLPDCKKDDVNIGDYVKIKECRPLSKLIHFVFTEKIRS